MELKAVLEQTTSKKTGKPVLYITIHLTENSKKIVFLEPSESELLLLKYGTKK